MENKQFTSDELNHSPLINQGFQAHRYSKPNLLNIPDTIPENTSGELSGDSLKMEAQITKTESFNYENKENITDNVKVKSNEFHNTRLTNPIDNSYIKQCEKKLLECSASDDEKNTDSDKSLVNKQPVKFSRDIFGNDTVSTPPSMLRKEISILRNEMAEAHEFHDLEIQLLQEEKFLNQADSNNYLELIEKYSALMELYTNLKTEYEDYRKEQERVKHELQSKTADCLESLCSQIETSDNSLNFSGASFVSFSSGIRSSTMMGDMSEVEATIVHDATLLGNDPLSVTADGDFKLPIRSAKKLFPQDSGKPVMKEVKEIISNREATVHLDSEYNLQLLNLETALYEKIKEVEDLEQRLFKVEDLSVAVQNEFERLTSENKTLKENLIKKTDQFNELTERLFTEIVSLKPSLRDSLVDIPEAKLLVVFIETIMESCKEIQEEQAIKHSVEKSDLEMRIENLQTEFENLKQKLSDAENTLLIRDDEITLLQSHLSKARQTREDFAMAREALSELEARLTLTEAEKTAAENRLRELESIVESLKRQMETEVKTKTAELEVENTQLKELCDSLKADIKSNEMKMASLREKVTIADETTLLMEAKIQSLESEKSELEGLNQNLRHRQLELQELCESLQAEIKTSKTKMETVQEGLKSAEELMLQLETEIQSLKAKNSELEEANQNLGDQQSKLQSENLLLKDLCDSLKTVVNESVVREKLTSAEEVVLQLRSNIQSLKTEKSELEKVNQNLREVRSELQAKSAQIESENLQLKESCNSLQTEIQLIEEKLTSANEITLQLQTELQSLQSEKSKLEEAHKNLQDQESELRIEHSKLKELCESAQTEIKSSESIRDKLTSAEETVVQLQTNIHSLEAELEKVSQNLRDEQSKTAQIENEYLQLKDFCESLKAEIESKETSFREKLLSAEEKLVQLQAENSQLEKTQQNLQDDLTKASSLNENTEVNSLKLQICEYEKAISSHISKVEQLVQELENLKKENSDLTKSVSAIEDLQNTLLQELSSDSDMLYERVFKLIQNSSEEHKIISVLFQTITRVKNEFTEKSTTQLNLIDTLQREIKLLTEINFEKEETIKSHIDALKRTKDDLQAADEIILKLKNSTSSQELDELKIIRDEMETENSHLKKRIVEFEEIMETLKKSLEDAEEGRKAKEAKIEELQIELDFLKDKHENLKNLESNNKNLVDLLSEIQAQLGISENILYNFENKKILNEKIKNLIEMENRQETNQLELDKLRKTSEGLRENLTDAQNTISAREDEIKILQSDLKQIQDDSMAVRQTLTDLLSRQSSSETEKVEAEKRYRELETIVETLKRDIEIKERQLSSLEEKKTEIESDNIRLRELCDSLKVQISQREEEISELRCDLEAKLSSREEEIRILQSNIKKTQEASDESSIEAEKRHKELQNIIESLKSEIEDMKNIRDENNDLKGKMTKVDEEIKILKSTDTELRKALSVTDSSLFAKDEQIQTLQSDIQQTREALSNQKTEAEKRYKELENEVENLKLEIDQMENLRAELNSQKLENAKAVLELTTFKENLQSADETIQKLQSKLQSVEVEKFELQETNQNLKTEITVARNNPAYEKIQNENDDLKQRIFEAEKMMVELKTELELAKEDQKNNLVKVEKLIREIEELKRENSDFSNALVTIEETQRNLADVLSDIPNDSDLPFDRIAKAIEKTKLQDAKIVSGFVETITKTCKGVQNELIKKFDDQKLEWETQREVDLRNLHDQIYFLTEKNDQLEAVIRQTKEDLAVTDEIILKLKSQLSSVESEKREVELRCEKLEENVANLQAEIGTKETIIKGIDELQLLREEIRAENDVLKQRIIESEEAIATLKKSLQYVQEERNSKDFKVQNLLQEIESLKTERKGLNKLSEKLQNLEMSNKNLIDVVSDVQSHLDMPEDALAKLLSGNLETKKLLSERINIFTQTQMEGLKAENQNLRVGNENLKVKVKQLVRLIGESASSELKEEVANLNVSQSHGMNLRSKSGRSIDLCIRRLDKLEEINHNLTELLTKILTMTDFQDFEKLKFCSVRDFPNVTKKVLAHINALQSKMKELKDENSQLDEECETYAKIIKDLKKEAAAVWKSNKEKTEVLEAEIDRLKEEKSRLETEKENLLEKISKLTSECQKLKSTSKAEGSLHTCVCSNESKRINELKRTILVKEQKILELQDLEVKSSSYKSQIEYLKTALDREKKKVGEEKEKNKRLQNELKETTKKEKPETKPPDENEMLDELRMRGSISGGIVQEFVDKEKMRKLSKDIGILKELCRARYAEIKRLEAVNAALQRNTPKNSNQMDSPIRSKGYNTRAKNQTRDLWKTEIIGKENTPS